MPKRTRDHVREDHSRSAFAKLIEPWILRDVKPDYGIDCEVEIVDPDDEVSGSTFKAQLKGTDDDDVSRALGVRVKTDRYWYALRHDVPVMLVRYHGPSDAFYGRWFHGFDVTPTRDQQTVTLRLQEGDRLTKSSLSFIRREVQHFRIVRTAGSLGRVDVRLWLPSGDVGGFTKVRIEAALERLLGESPNALRVSRSSDALVTVRMTHKDLRVNVAGGSGIRLALDERAAQNIDVLVRDVAVVVAGTLARLGHPVLAAPILSRWFPESSVVHDMSALAEVGHTLVRAARPEDLIALAKLYQERHDAIGWDAVHVLYASLLGVDLDDAHADQLEALLRDRALEAAQLGNQTAHGEASYNLASFVRSRHRHEEAIALYEEAASADPSYLERDYWHLEQGSNRFLTDDFAGATRDYGRALELGNNVPGTRAVYADALMFSGRYREGLANFMEYEKVAEDPVAEWTLKAVGLAWLCDGPLSTSDQVREPERALELLQSEAESATDQFFATIEASLAADALCGPSLINWGIAHGVRQGSPYDVASATLLGALVIDSDADAWLRALVASSDGMAFPGLLQPILDVAYWKCGEELVEHFEDIYARVVGGGIPADLQDALQAAADAVVKRQKPAVFRLIHADGKSIDVLRVTT